MPKLTITLDDSLMACLDELADFEGENVEETLRIAIRAHYQSFVLFRQEALETQRRPPQGPEADDVIPL